MRENSQSASSARAARAGVFLGVFGAVFMLVVAATALVTFMMPEVYASAARVRIIAAASAMSPTNAVTATTARPEGGWRVRIWSRQPEGATPAPVSSSSDLYFVQTQVEVVRSEAVLGQVIDDLDLNTVWGRRFAHGERLKTVESLERLKQNLRVRPVPHTYIIEISAYSEDRLEAATLANRVLKSYTGYVAADAPELRVEVLDVARPSLTPIRPNKPLNLALGVLLGMVLGAGSGGLAAWWFGVWRLRREGS